MSSEQSGVNRWVIVIGAILIQLCLGAIYAWSAFTGALAKPVAEGGYGFTASQTQWIFSVGLAVFAIMTVVSGRLTTKYTPRTLALSGGVILGLGYILGGLLGKTFPMQLLCIGLIGGAGIGMAYVVPIAVCVKWFPDKKGLITGLAVAGFGFGATIWVKLAGGFKTILWLVPMPFDGLLKTVSLAGLPGVQSVFIVYGIAFLVLVVLGSLVMINPPAGYSPPGWKAPVAGTPAASGALNFNESQMLGTPQFYMIFLTFAGSAMAGLMVIGCIQLFGIDALQASKAAADVATATATAGTAMAMYAILNGLGRIAWGAISDRIGRKTSIVLMCASQAVMMAVLFYLGRSNLGLTLAACVIGFNFGGNFALFPAITADFFGNANVGRNYGYVFLSYGAAGIAGPYIAGYFKDAAKASGAGVNAWLTPFMIAAAACAVAAVIAALTRPPKQAPGR
ncbi:MAG TPA: OFA family MFS transporter [Candidatus Hydrogenedentes bacterium]|nr:OFA family MFS transporter [Candidatus Hydrogenedentota bacterium]